METEDLTPEREEQLMVAILRDRGGIDPDTLGPVTDLVALALVNSGWRNTCIENWHAEGRMHDGDMMRINSHATWCVRQRLRGWMLENDLAADASVSALDHIPGEAVMDLSIRIYRWFVNRRRKLPTGVTLGDLAGGGLSEYVQDAELAMGAFAWQAENRGARFGFMRAAAHGALACRHWWGHPHWPDLVERFLSALDDPGDEHWGDNGEFRIRLPPEPAAVADRRLLRKALLSGPWTLSSDTTEWLVSAGIGHLPF